MSTTHVTVQPKILYFGTPVVLLCTENADGTANLAPMSSAWALGQVVVLGLDTGSQTAHNLTARPDLVINVPDPSLWPAVERLAPLTGRNPVPPHKPTHRYEPAKFEAAGLRRQPSRHVGPPCVAECPLQLEARADHVRPDAGGEFLIVEARVLAVHATPEIVVAGTQHIDPNTWSPLIYNFRHYFALGDQLGHSYRSETRPDSLPSDPATAAVSTSEGAGAWPYSASVRSRSTMCG